MFHIVTYMYQPNTAAGNRLLAFIQNLSQQNVETTLHILLPDPVFNRIQGELSNVRVMHYWETIGIKSRPLHYFLKKLYLRKVRDSFDSGDAVLLYGLSSQLSFFRKREDIKLYHECTESPLVISPGNLDEYIKACKELDGLFVISNQLRSYFIQEGVRAERIETINMIADTSRFEGLEKRSHKDKYLAYCGNLSNTKDGVDLLIKAFAEVHAEYPDYELYLIGQKEKNANEQLINDLGLDHYVICTGTVSAKEMPQMLKDADMLLLCRPDNLQAQYGFPTKLGEYLLTANPVVVTAVGDIPIYLHDGKNAMVSQAGNTHEFARKIIWLLNNPAEAKKIGEDGRVTALEHFNGSIETKKMIDFIRK